jgi:hypothetical protein
VTEAEFHTLCRLLVDVRLTHEPSVSNAIQETVAKMVDSRDARIAALEGALRNLRTAENLLNAVGAGDLQSRLEQLGTERAEADDLLAKAEGKT